MRTIIVLLLLCVCALYVTCKTRQCEGLDRALVQSRSVLRETKKRIASLMQALNQLKYQKRSIKMGMENIIHRMRSEGCASSIRQSRPRPAYRLRAGHKSYH